jgi:hypothetical protein
MGILWALIAAAALLMVLAGTQAIRMTQDLKADVIRLQGNIATAIADKERAERQVEAERVVLFQAKAWIEAKAKEEQTRLNEQAVQQKP